MDKQGRLTRRDEWEVGSKYRWKKGRYVSLEVVICEELNEHGVVLKHEDGETSWNPSWRNRYIPVEKQRKGEHDEPNR